MSHITRDLIASAPGGPIPLWVLIVVATLVLGFLAGFGYWALRK